MITFLNDLGFRVYQGEGGGGKQAPLFSNPYATLMV
jgi:hypothetical protein